MYKDSVCLEEPNQLRGWDFLKLGEFYCTLIGLEGQTLNGLGNIQAILCSLGVSIFCIRLGGTGGIDELGVNVEVTKHVVGCWVLLWLSGSTITWSRSRPKRWRR